MNLQWEFQDSFVLFISPSKLDDGSNPNLLEIKLTLWKKNTNKTGCYITELKCIRNIVYSYGMEVNPKMSSSILTHNKNWEGKNPPFKMASIS